MVGSSTQASTESPKNHRRLRFFLLYNYPLPFPMRSLFISKISPNSAFLLSNFRFRIPIAALRSLTFSSFHRSPPPMPPRMAMVSHVDSEGPLARRLWNKCRRESIFSMYTPFCVCLACGTLDVDTFRHVVDQDVHFLKAFAQA